MTSEQMIAEFQGYLAHHDGYIPGTSGQLWTREMQDRAAANDAGVAKYGEQWIGHHVEDCSGAFVRAYRKYGLSIYHGSNRIAREYVVKLLPPDRARPGMAAFKARQPGAQLYALPNAYKPGGKYYDGDLNDYYHIGLVDADPRYVINAQAVRTGVVRSKLADNWHFVAALKAVSDEEETPMEELHQAVVTAENGKPVNLRKAPSIQAARICAVPVDSRVAVLNEVDADWAEIRYGAQTGYMMRKFLKRVEQAPDARLVRLKALLQEAEGLVDALMGG